MARVTTKARISTKGSETVIEKIYYVSVLAFVVSLWVCMLYGMYALPRDLYRSIRRRRARHQDE